MDIIVSTPGSPGTSFTDEVKEKIINIFDAINTQENFASASALREHLEKTYGYKQAYMRNIMAFLLNCGIVDYQSSSPLNKETFFTDIGYAFVDILKCIKTANDEPESEERDEILNRLKKIEEILYFQGLVIMMKKKDCSYSTDFFDVLRFTKQYQHIDSTEYLLILYEREQSPNDYLQRMQDRVNNYRNGLLNINIKTKTKNNESGDAKSVNSFPYVHGNFTKSGVLVKVADNQFSFNEDRKPEIDKAIEEVEAAWQT